MFGLVGTENLGWSQGVGEVFGGVLPHGQKCQVMGGFQDMKITNFHGVLFKRKRLNSKKWIWEGTNREEVSKDSNTKFWKKNPCQSKGSF